MPGGVKVLSADRVIRCRPAPARCEQIWKQVSDSRCSASTGNYSARSPSKVNACPTKSASACGSPWLRATARRLRVPFRGLSVVCRRQELGELTSRLHYHGLIAGLPPDALCPSLNFELMAALSNRSAAAGPESPFTRTTATAAFRICSRGWVTPPDAERFYEFGKFGSQHCDLMLSSNSAIRIMRRAMLPRHQTGKQISVTSCARHARSAKRLPS